MRHTLREIASAVAFHYKMTYDHLMVWTNRRKYARPRQLAMWLARQMTAKSYPAIGDFFGGRDHTTALWADRKIAKLILENEQLAADAAAIRAAVEAKGCWVDRQKKMLERQRLVEQIETAQDQLAELDREAA